VTADAAIAWPLTTERLTVRPATPQDAHAVWRYRSLPDVARWMTSDAQDETMFTVRFVAPDRLPYTFPVLHDGTVIGDLFLRVEDGWAQSEIVEQARGTQAEIGWAFDPAHHGRGFATESAGRLVRAAFAENTPSWRLMERLGMRREGSHRADSLLRDGRWVDSYTYALLREEWADRRRPE
jgi:RimJ/RimL family protein N-acetyltransferase